MTDQRLRCLTLLLAVLSLACRAPGGVPTGLLETDRAAIMALLEKDTQAGRASDWNALTALYATDAVRMPPNQPTVTGRDAIRAFHGQFPKLDSFAFSLIELDGRGDLAWYRGKYAMSFTLPGTKQSMADSGKLVAVLRKQPDGSWLTVADIWNSDLPVGR